MPPSPRLSALRIKIAYLSETMTIRAHRISETMPRTASGAGLLPPADALTASLKCIQRARSYIAINHAECAENCCVLKP